MTDNVAFKSAILKKVDEELLQGIFIVTQENSHFTCVYSNETFAKFIGVEQSEILGRSFSSSLNKEEIEQLESQFSEALERQRTQKHDAQYSWPSGRQSWLIQMEPLPDQNTLFCQFFDQTDYDRARQSVAEAERQRNDLFSVLSGIILTIDRRGMIADIEQNQQSSPALKPFDYIGKPYKEIIHERFQSKFSAWIEEARSDTSSLSFSLEFQGVIEGKLRALEAKVINAGNDDVRLFIHDIAHRVSRNAASSSKNTASTGGIFDNASLVKLSNVSMGLLKDITESSHFISNSAENTENTKYVVKNAQEIHQKSEMLLSGIAQMLEIIKIEDTSQPLKKSLIDVEQSTRLALSRLKNEIEMHRLQIKLNFLTRGVRIQADESMLRQALLCLLKNAIQFTDKGGIITVHILQSGEGISCIAIENTGTGITEENLTKIQQPFVKLENESTGLGLGLSLAKACMKRHGGAFNIKNKPESGIRCELIFPAEPAVSQRKQA